MCTESRVVAKVVRQGKLVRSGVAVAAAVACAMAATVPALASAGSTGRPARHGDRPPGYRRCGLPDSSHLLLWQ